VALDGQALAALGAACVDDSAATTGFHTHQKAMGTGAARFGGLVSAFHVESFRGSVLPRRMRPGSNHPEHIQGNRRLLQVHAVKAMICAKQLPKSGVENGY
jgi:hypothetical protein